MQPTMVTGSPFDTFYGALAFGRDEVPAPRRRLTQDIDCDVCVIGAGFAGLWTARALAARGHEVVVIDRARVGAGASGRNAGFVGPGFSLDLEQLVRRVGIEPARALWALSREGVEMVRALAHGAGPDAALRPVAGRLDVWMNEDEARNRRRADWLAHRFDTPCEPWSTRELQDVLRTPTYQQALHFPEAFHLDPLALALHLANDLETQGVRLFEATEAREGDLAGVRKHVQTESGRVRAHHVVLCAGVPSGRVLPAAGRAVMPISSAIGVSEDLGDRLGAVVQYAGGVCDPRRAGPSFRRIGDRLLWGSGASTRAAPPRRLAARLAGEIGAVFPTLKGVRIEHAWVGTMAYAVHAMPLIGRLEPGVWIASGLGGRGVAMAAIAGELVAAGIVESDERWKMFAPFGLVDTGGALGRLAAELRLRAASLRRQ
ncbi:NAD(P)/FAD-dependent oxidoreductase [Ancylobacter pratisalsi]|uniref:FAD-binding oxidoreductase n=1 Tax=Ancylobacter pratisalsi TaxID=1745854 RepID=A0A6P1YR97_9HYPH|nr:FAD-binding oxidoreductase [Ancylobacter pratisalsi]QIB35420.1 FAD-binding oxidoreductase [Ancylobacter pratisalsi]